MNKALPLLILLSACSNGEPVHSVNDFIADDTMLAQTISKCRENPGELSQPPDCKNTHHADWKFRLERMGKALGG